MSSRRRPGLRAATALVLTFALGLGFVNFSTPSTSPVTRRTEIDATQYIPLKVASFAMGALRPFFQVQASVQAGRYDKWEVRKEIEEEIKSAPVVIYTYDWSPFSSEAKKVLDSMGADYREVSLGAEWFLASPEQAAKRAELGNLYGRTSMPHVFIGGRSVGGLMEGDPGLVPLQETGELSDSLKQAGALPDDGLFGFFLYSGDHRP
mmetsp:Transcript_44900/g.71334  ORF Transcript_44900/g.71334 Transcript_44900/m.71334 type:complete len:207 (-) Transcript_44900:69-689(-)